MVTVTEIVIVTETEGEREPEALKELLDNDSDFCAYCKNAVRVRVRRERGVNLIKYNGLIRELGLEQEMRKQKEKESLKH